MKPQHLCPFNFYIEMNAEKQIFSREDQGEGNPCFICPKEHFSESEWKVSFVFCVQTLCSI